MSKLLRPSVASTVEDILSMSKADFDAEMTILEIALSPAVYQKVIAWIADAGLITHKNGQDIYTANFSARHGLHNAREVFMLRHGGVSGNRLPDAFAELKARTPNLNAIFRHIARKYPAGIYAVKHGKPGDSPAYTRRVSGYRIGTDYRGGTFVTMDVGQPYRAQRKQPKAGNSY